MIVFWVGTTSEPVANSIYQIHPWKLLADLEQLKRNFQRASAEASILLAVHLQWLSLRQAKLFLNLKRAFPKLRLTVIADQIETLADLELHKDPSILLIPSDELMPRQIYQAWLLKGQVRPRKGKRVSLKSDAEIQSDFSGKKYVAKFSDFSNQGARITLHDSSLAEKEFVLFQYKDQSGKIIRVQSQIRWRQQISTNEFSYGLQFIGVL